MLSKEERYDQAIALQQAGRIDEAIAELENLAKDHPDYALAYAALSVFYSRQGRHEEAIEAAQRVCELEPDDPFSFVALSLIAQKAGELPLAESALMEARRAQFEAWRRARLESQEKGGG
ncbi:MAG: tetratricopeptide repeat protein [Thermoguttaceae bacterium]|nr:tetratricopeptide repeat protein [Thermoguttaceae bacterium]MDW8080042.1 tetratricopeptide repeat protein [Thermoguttaceae bacterium]